jgi:hypothetical protein
MAQIPEYFSVGDRVNIDADRLLIILEEIYTQLAIAINQKVSVVQRTTNGLVTDTFLPNGTININNSTNKVEMLTNHPTATTVTWTTLS